MSNRCSNWVSARGDGTGQRGLGCAFYCSLSETRGQASDLFHTCMTTCGQVPTIDLKSSARLMKTSTFAIKTYQFGLFCFPLQEVRTKYHVVFAKSSPLTVNKTRKHAGINKTGFLGKQISLIYSDLAQLAVETYKSVQQCFKAPE